MLGKMFRRRKREVMTIECNAQILSRKGFLIRQFYFDGVKRLSAGRQQLKMRFNFKMSLWLGHEVNCQVLFFDGIAGTEGYRAGDQECERR